MINFSLLCCSMSVVRRYFQPTRSRVKCIAKICRHYGTKLNPKFSISSSGGAVVYKKNVVSLQKDVYCRGELLHRVQIAQIYPDSKAFVDKKMKYDPEQILDNFSVLAKSKQEISHIDLEKFLEQNFEDEHGFERHIPPDWGPYPEFINHIENPYMQQFALDVHSMWRTLGRRINEDVRSHASRYSLIYTPKPFVIPGGRFREFYYWDSYWILRGLILSEMHETCRNMIENYLYLVDNFGFIPNGGRIYYTDRSQPPLLCKMLEDYIKATHDIEFLFAAVPTLEKEYFFWVNERMITVEKGSKKYKMFHYGSDSHTPRPESYREDYDWAQVLPKRKKAKFYNEVRAAAESGIDFSGRWWVPSWQSDPPFTDIHTTYIIPVDLNSYMHMNANILAKFYEMIGVKYKQEYYLKEAEHYQEAIMDVLWNDTLGCWLDYDHVNKKARYKFYPTNLTPLWTKSFPPDMAVQIADRVVSYLKEVKIESFDGGIPGSTEVTGQQWDLPNAWAPQQDLVITGLMNLPTKDAQNLGRTLADNWIGHNYITYKQDHVMYEKYSASMVQTGGWGGEYENQTGFGWTNGVLLDFLNKFGDYNFKEEDL